MSKILKIENIVDSVSITHKFPNPEVIFLNTSDILEGKILCHDYSNVSTLKGQAKKTIKNGDILFSEIRPKNKRYAFVNVSKPEDYVVSTKLMVLRNKNKDVLTEYFYYFLTYSGTLNYLQMRAENRIGSFPQITFDILKPISLDIPEIDVQSRIVKLISALDRKIELNDRINAELEAMAKTVYDYWFVQFDFPDENGKPYKSSGGKMVWNKELKREIPERWRVRKLEEFADIQRGSMITEKTAITTGNIKVVAAGVDYSYMHNTHNRKPNTITVSSSGANAGYLNLWREKIFASDCITVRGRDDNQTFYIWGYLNLVKDYILNQAKGSAQPHVYPSDIQNLYWVIPDNDTLDRFRNISIPTNRKIACSQTEIKQFTELRDWLLPMLMNGQVKISD